jgi:glycosyl hydrolase family 35/beta-galactosidase-like protein
MAAAPLAATLGRAEWPLLGAPLSRDGQMKFAKPAVIRYDAHCFTINDRDIFLRSGSFHYCRCPRELWSDRLLKFKLAGFNAIQTYVFWNYHEPAEGHADLSEFDDFIQAVQAAGLWLIVRPGPYVCAEWDVGGFPHWVVAKQFPLRSDDPESVKTSQHWFDLVLPIIRRRQITQGGPVILMQLENEYDYWPRLPDENRRTYISALAHMAWDAGIEVPLFTCWTHQARENNDPDMARIMDTCNFYPRWKIFPDVPEQLKKLRDQEPESPMGIAELQGGWFSGFGDKLSADQEGIDAAQLNMLTKTVIEQGVTFYNYYMGLGGTNFDWAAKGMTTTYDYAAPIREPGGLWDKYYAARGICNSLGLFADVLTRAGPLNPGCESSNASVSVSERVSGKSAVIFLRENANADQTFKMTFVDLASPTHRKITVPREGFLAIGARDMKMFPVQIPIEGGTLRYSTAEVLASGLFLDRYFLLVYDDPGRLVEISLAAERQPHVEGDFQYLYWDDDYESVVLGVRVDAKEKFLIVNNQFLIVVIPRQRALQSWKAEFPLSVVPGAEGTGPMTVPFITDAVLPGKNGASKSAIWMDLHFRPGTHDVTALVPPEPSACAVDGEPAEFQYDRPHRAATLQITTPSLPSQPLDLTELNWWAEGFGAGKGEWKDTALQSLDETGAVPYGYVKYRAELPQSVQPARLFIKSFTEDEKKVFVNGKLVPDLSNSKPESDALVPQELIISGTNTIEIAYEAFGSFNFGKKLGELKGLAYVKIGADAAGAQPIAGWKLQRFALPMRGRAVDVNYSGAQWQSATIAAPASDVPLTPSFTWCKAEFRVEQLGEEWFAPCKLTFESDRDALLYLNGRFIGRYVTVGPQKDFYLPEPYLDFGKKNTLTFVLAYAAEPGHVRTLRVGRFEEFAYRRTRVEFGW